MIKRQACTVMLVAVLCSAWLCGCTNSGWKNITTLGSDAHVRLYSGGVLIGEWDSSGKVITEDHSDGYRFVDKKTGKLVRIAGQIIIEN